MGLFSNSENYIILQPKHGRNTGKKYVYKESSRRWSLLKHYIKNRTDQYKDHPYFCMSGIQQDGKWDFGSYSFSPTCENLPVPELIYHIPDGKVYVFEAQLWELTEYVVVNIDEVIESEKYQ